MSERWNHNKPTNHRFGDQGHGQHRMPGEHGGAMNHHDHWGHIDYLYEDRDIIVVVKPAGLAVISPEGSRAKSLYDLVTDHMRRTSPRARPALVHRLDRDTSGVMMFAKSAAGKKILMSRWNDLVKERTYVALVEGALGGEAGVFDSWLVENRAGTVYAAEPGTRGALRAITRWRALETCHRYQLLELSLETGRKHQIRAQLSAAGHPVAGDSRYGAQSDPLKRLCLHATLLAVEHPFTHEVMRFESPYPEEFLAPLGSAVDARRHEDPRYTSKNR